MGAGAANSRAVIQREGGRVWIEGAPELAWGKSGECTFVGALTAATAVTGYPCDYRRVMGATGLAYRARWFQGTGEQRWCPSSPVGEMSDEITAARRATGWALREEWDWQGTLERFQGGITASIDAGLPVLTYDPNLNVAVIIGYADGGGTLLVNEYGGETQPVARALSDLKAMLIFPGEHAEPLSERDAALQAMRMAVRNWHRKHDPPDDEERGYWYGDAALSRWHNDIGAYDKLSNKQREQLFSVSWWCFDSLFDARHAATEFVKEATMHFGDQARECLEQAASIYDRESRLLASAFEEKDAFLGPWTGKAVRDWAAEVRRREQEILASARRLDASAIADIEGALEAAGG